MKGEPIAVGDLRVSGPVKIPRVSPNLRCFTYGRISREVGEGGNSIKFSEELIYTIGGLIARVKQNI